MDNAFNIALVGAGGIAAAHRAAADASNGRVKIVAVVETGADAPAAAGLPRYESVAGLVESEHRPDAVIVCTPPSVRAEVIEPALKAGLAVLCEKPLSRTAAEADELVKIAEKHDATGRCFVGYCHRFTPAIVEMRRRLRSGELGSAVRLENTFACWHPTMQTRWMSDEPVSGGGSFLDTGCHSLDLFRFVFDEKPGDGKVLGAAFHREWAGRGESNATVLLRAGNGAAGAINSGWQEAERFTVTLVGTRGSLGYDYLKADELVWQPSDPSFGDPEVIRVESHDVRFTRQLEAFARRVRGEAQDGDENLCDFAAAAEVATLIDAAVASARNAG